jgi:hypothetical protein
MEYLTNATSESKNIKPIVEKVLSSNYMNDYVLEQAYLGIVFLMDSKETFAENGVKKQTMKYDMINFAYRILWEQRYLRRTSIGTISEIRRLETKDDRIRFCVVLKISIAEAIDYIRQVTPPLFRDRTMENLKSIDSVMSMLNFYLSDKSHEKKYRMDLFCKCIGMYQFPTEWNYNNKRFDTIFSNFMKPLGYVTGVIDISDQPIAYYKQHKDEKDNWFIDGYPLQFSIEFNFDINTDQNGFEYVVDNIAKFLHIYNKNNVLNVKYNSETNKLYMSIFTTCMTNHLCKCINTWYNQYE